MLGFLTPPDPPDQPAHLKPKPHILQMTQNNLKQVGNGLLPFLRWAGGKRWLTKEIGDFLPSEIQNYHEIFLGSGAMYIYLLNNNLIKGKAYLADINPQLIQAFNVVKNDVETLIVELRKFKNDRDFYYKVRQRHFDDASKMAARFIYLNRTSFNGIYRENLQGIYNVPYGNKQYKKLFDYSNLRRLAIAIQGAKFSAVDFNQSLKNVKAGDLVFIDPPYTVAHQFNGFVKYNQKIFSWGDQELLRDKVVQIKNEGARFILTNAHHDSITKLYKGVGRQVKLERYSVVGGTGALRKKYNEILITNL